MLRKYCKAYYLKDLRQFSAWTEKREADEPELTDKDVIYLWDDFTVVRSPVIPDKGLIFDTITSEWQGFCTTRLQFTIPEDLRYAYEEQETAEPQEVSETSGEEQSTATV